MQQHEMRITFIQTLSTERELFLADHDYDVNDTDALRYINSGIARKSVEPSNPRPASEPNTPALKRGERVGKDADRNKPAATPIAVPKEPPAHNPAAFLHGSPTGNAVAEPHTGFTTTEPDAKTSPPSDGRSPLAFNHGPEAVGSPQTGEPPKTTPAPPTPVTGSTKADTTKPGK